MYHPDQMDDVAMGHHAHLRREVADERAVRLAGQPGRLADTPGAGRSSPSTPQRTSVGHPLAALALAVSAPFSSLLARLRESTDA